MGILVASGVFVGSASYSLRSTIPEAPEPPAHWAGTVASASASPPTRCARQSRRRPSRRPTGPALWRRVGFASYSLRSTIPEAPEPPAHWAGTVASSAPPPALALGERFRRRGAIFLTQADSRVGRRHPVSDRLVRRAGPNVIADDRAPRRPVPGGVPRRGHRLHPGVVHAPGRALAARVPGRAGRRHRPRRHRQAGAGGRDHDATGPAPRCRCRRRVLATSSCPSPRSGSGVDIAPGHRAGDQGAVPARGPTSTACAPSNPSWTRRTSSRPSASLRAS